MICSTSLTLNNDKTFLYIPSFPIKYNIPLVKDFQRKIGFKTRIRINDFSLMKGKEDSKHTVAAHPGLLL